MKQASHAVPSEVLLAAVGQILEAAGERHSIVIVGGACMNLLNIVSRATDDVDIIAAATANGDAMQLVHPDPLPDALIQAASTVSRYFSVPPNWLNTTVAMQWRSGLPPSMNEGISWRTYGGLEVGLAGRSTLIALKLFAAVDSGPGSVHFNDLLALSPSPDELSTAASWVLTQDAAQEFESLIDDVVKHVISAR